MTANMRITEGMAPARLLNDLRRAQNSVNQSSAQISSGSRLLDASIDPLATHRALRLRQELTNFESMQETVAQAKGWMQTTDQSLTTINDAVHRARELVLQAVAWRVGAQLELADIDAVRREIETYARPSTRR